MQLGNVGEQKNSLLNNFNRYDDVSDLIPLENCFSFTMFKPVPAVCGYAAQGDIIVENNGIFSISDKIETSAVKIDPAFKQLVDSILI